MIAVDVLYCPDVSSNVYFATIAISADEYGEEYYRNKYHNDGWLNIDRDMLILSFSNISVKLWFWTSIRSAGQEVLV
jgi:hypothetical protein